MRRAKKTMIGSLVGGGRRRNLGSKGSSSARSSSSWGALMVVAGLVVFATYNIFLVDDSDSSLLEKTATASSSTLGGERTAAQQDAGSSRRVVTLDDISKKKKETAKQSVRSTGEKKQKRQQAEASKGAVGSDSHGAKPADTGVGEKKTPTVKNEGKSNENQHQPSTTTTTPKSMVTLNDELRLERDAPPSKSLFYVPQVHDPLGSIGEIGRRKYANLDLWRDDRNAQQRELLPYDTDEQLLQSERKELLKHTDGSTRDYLLRFEERDYPRDCVRPAWTDLQFPFCNAFHELQTETVDPDWNVRYLSSGYYRDTFLLERPRQQQQQNQGSGGNQQHKHEAFVWKRIRIKDGFDYGLALQNQIRTEALIMERMSGSNRTTNIYGYCATSLAVEVARDLHDVIVPLTDHQTEQGRIPQEKLEQLQQEFETPIFNFNNFTVPEKLELTIAIAEGVAEMHGFEGSVIVNDDVHPEQWLKTDDGRIILNDMNNAKFLQWNYEKQEYCPYYSSYGGDFRAPEEYVGADVDESVDIYPIGNMIFSILTGLWPWYEIPHKRRPDLQEKAIAGEKPYLNPLYRNHSFIEGRLVELMERCYTLQPQKRPDIFEVVKHLHETRRLHLEEQSQQRKTDTKRSKL